MKMISKLSLVCLMSLMCTSAFALQVAKPHVNVSAKNIFSSQVMLVNLTRESYMAYSMYRPTNESYRLPLNSAGTTQDRILYPIVYPVYDVCLDVVQDYSGQHVYRGCEAAATIYIHYGLDKKSIVVSKN